MPLKVLNSNAGAGMNKTVYVLGFAFTPEADKVVLIRKKHPAWQAGLLNGVGGKVEKDELHVDAMVREFYEETGVLISADQWERRGRIFHGAGLIHVFTCRTADVMLVRTTTDEEVLLLGPLEVQEHELVENVPTLVMACLMEHSQKDGTKAQIEFIYPDPV
jgi:8-oxo-dGTP diphosphatase